MRWSNCRQFPHKMNNYKCCSCKYAERKSAKQQHLFDHFIEDNHNDFVQDVSVTFINKTDPSDPSRRDALKTLVPKDLSISESA